MMFVYLVFLLGASIHSYNLICNSHINGMHVWSDDVHLGSSIEYNSRSRNAWVGEFGSHTCEALLDSCTNSLDFIYLWWRKYCGWSTQLKIFFMVTPPFFNHSLHF